jgi:hypothetical protein
MLRTDKKFQKMADEIFGRKPAKQTSNPDADSKSDREKKLTYEETRLVR